MPDLTEEIRGLYDELRQDRIDKLEAQITAADEAQIDEVLARSSDRLDRVIEESFGRLGQIVDDSFDDSLKMLKEMNTSLGDLSTTLGRISANLDTLDTMLDPQPIPSPGAPMYTGPVRYGDVVYKDTGTEPYDELAHRLRSIVSLTATPQERARAPISTLHESVMLDRIEALCGVSIGHDERVDLLIRLRGPRHQLNKRECVEILERFELERWDGMMRDFKQHVTESYTEAAPAPVLIV